MQHSPRKPRVAIVNGRSRSIRNASGRHSKWLLPYKSVCASETYIHHGSFAFFVGHCIEVAQGGSSYDHHPPVSHVCRVVYNVVYFGIDARLNKPKSTAPLPLYRVLSTMYYVHHLGCEVNQFHTFPNGVLCPHPLRNVATPELQPSSLVNHHCNQ